MDFRTIIKEKRSSKGMSQLQLSKVVGISQPFMHEIEAGKKSPSVEVLIKICQALEIRVTMDGVIIT